MFVSNALRRKTLFVPGVPVMSPSMVVLRPSVVVCARPVPDNYHVSELVDVSVAAMLIDENHLHVPMAIMT
jgi:hypothetical protein